jgi:ABC-type branched-subunit amino acid transport system substrate-binding protein
MPPMSRAPVLRTRLTATVLVAVAAATTATVVSLAACSVVTRVEFAECTVSTDCRGGFGLGWVCGEAGLCQEVEAPDRCDRVFPKDLLKDPDKYRDAIIFGSLFDHNTVDGDLKLVNAASLAIDEANASGLTDGRLFGIVHCDYQENVDIDDKTSEEAAVDGAKYLVDQLGAVAIIGPGTSGFAEAVFVELQKPEHAPQAVIISPSATSPSLTDIDVRDGDKPGLFWRTAPPDSQLGADLALRMAEEGIESGTVIYENGSYGTGLQGALSENFPGELELLAFESLEDIVKHAETVGAQTGGEKVAVVFIGSEVDQVARFVNAASPFPFYQDSRIYLGDAAYNSDFLKNTAGAKDLYPNIRGVFPGSPSGPIYDAFVSRYRAVFNGEDPEDASYSAHTYDATWLALYGTAWAEYQREGELIGINLAYGLQRISDPSGVAVNVNPDSWNVVKREFKANHSIDITGASGDLKYDPEDEETTATVVYWKINDAGNDFENVP